MRKALIILSVVLSASSIALAGLNAYRAEHWILGRVQNAPNGTIVQLYREGAPLQAVTGAVTDGNYRINALALGWRDNNIERWLPAQTLMAEVRDIGIGATAGPVSLKSTGAGYESMPDMIYTADFLDIPYGPQVRLEALFQALANTTDWTHSAPVTVVVEARTGNSSDTANTLVGQAIISLGENGNIIGRNGFIRPDGTPFPENAPMADGNYYLAVKQRLTSSLAGIGHLSVITNRSFNLTWVPGNRDASTTMVDLTNDPAVVEDAAAKIFKEVPYKPAPAKPDALFTNNNRLLFRAGDMDGNQVINAIDTSHWNRLFTRFKADGAAGDDPNDPYIRADLNRDGAVNAIDISWWNGAFENLVTILNDPGPHGYVPEIIP